METIASGRGFRLAMNAIAEKENGGRMENQGMDLNRLGQGTPGITPEFGACLAQAAAVCLEEQGHSTGAIMDVDGVFESTFSVLWDRATEQMKKCWGDVEVTTEHGAYGVAILLVINLTEYTIIERSKKGTGFDFWLGHANDTEPLFQGKARLEVSGIRSGNERAISDRVRRKVTQVGMGKSKLPGIIIVEFSGPRSRIMNK